MLKIRRRLILLMCFWLPLQTVAGPLLSCIQSQQPSSPVIHEVAATSSNQTVRAVGCKGHQQREAVTSPATETKHKSPQLQLNAYETSHDSIAECDHCQIFCQQAPPMMSGNSLATVHVTTLKTAYYAGNRITIFLDAPDRPPQLV